MTTNWVKGQAMFNQGMGQLHGFWYYEAERTFREIASRDPNCAMAYWGMAMANWGNTKRAKGFIAKASELKEKKSLREKSYTYLHKRPFLQMSRKTSRREGRSF